MAAVSKEEYLKRYLSGGDVEGKKKKKKKDKKEKESSSKKGNGIRVYEDDAFASVATEDYHGMDSDEDIEIEMIQEAIKNKVKKGNMKGSFKSTFTSLGGYADIKEEPVDDDESFHSSAVKQECREEEQKVQITLGSKSSKSETRVSRRQRHDSDQSPARSSNQRHDSDNSPVRSRRRHDSDNSPVRKRTRHDSAVSSSTLPISLFFDGSPPRRKAASPARRKRHDSDASPPRRKRHTSPDQSPPRRRRHDSDASPPRRQRQASPDQSPPRRRQRHDSDASPPRNRRQTSPSPPRRRQRRDSDQSPPRGGRRGSDSDQSPPRKRRVASPTVEGLQKTLDGKVAGLQSAKALRDESDKLRAREAKMFEDLDTSVSGRNAETVVREKVVGKRKGKESQEDQEKKEREAKKQAELQEKYKDWNRGMKQVQGRQEQLDEMARVVAGPMTRTREDVDMNKYLKEVIHESDPMAALIKKKNKEEAIDRGDLVYPTYDKPFHPNRYGIRPGYRWDGVDRSNGFEAKLASSQNIRRAEEKEFYANMNTFD